MIKANYRKRDYLEPTVSETVTVMVGSMEAVGRDRAGKAPGTSYPDSKPRGRQG